ncbi:MAG: hypothetical protein ACFFDD_14330, partial [Promethearchaeota archaeon]
MMFCVSIHDMKARDVGAAGPPRRTFRIRGALPNRMHGKIKLHAQDCPSRGNRDLELTLGPCLLRVPDGGSHANLFERLQIFIFMKIHR